MSHKYSVQFDSMEGEMNTLWNNFVEGDDSAGVEIIILASLLQAKAEAVKSVGKEREAKKLSQYTLEEVINDKQNEND